MFPRPAYPLPHIVPTANSTTPTRLLRRAATLLALVAGACGSPDGATIDRDVFVATYADLRVAALDTDSARIADAARDEILARHGVTEEDLVTFAEVHSDQLEYMRDVWADVEAAMDREPPGSDDSDPNR